MTNADKFKGIFGIYATELWAKPEKEFLEWLNEDVPDTNVGDMISRQAAIDDLKDMYHAAEKWGAEASDDMTGARAESCMASLIEMKLRIEKLPSAQPEISRIEQELHDKTPEEQYEFLYWLLSKFGRAYTDSRLAVVEWLRGEKDDK